MKLLASAVLATSLLVGATGCPNKSRGESIKLSNEGSKASGQKQWETAIERFQKATERWRDNHQAWYGLAGAYMNKQQWDKAADAMEKCVQIAPEIAMYHQMYGRALYEKAVDAAKEEQAHKENKKKEEIQVDLTAVNFEKALGEFQEAVKLNGDLWRAHYYIGRIYRDTDKPKEAAEALTKAVSYGPTEAAPYVALGELYRKWDYSDQALTVAQSGTALVPGDNEVSDIWYVVGMAYDDKRQDDKAIEAFNKALESRRDNHKAQFQRGQAYFRKGDYTNAKKDLEEFSKSGGASVEFAKQQASKMLLDIAAKSATQNNAPPAEKPSPEEMVKKGKK
jgi:tetratricopeptide (TPR) repeat protein